jgi:hypothetical protein
MRFLPATVGTIVLSATTALLPASAADPPRFASITFENDFFAGYDQHYTNGLQLAVLADLKAFPRTLRDLPPFAWSDDPQAVIAIGQRMYTPVDTDIDPPDPHDRPYAGWLYVMTDVRTRSVGTLDHLTMTLGVVGPASGARETQDIAHRALDEPRSKGWEWQVRNKATFMAGFERAWPSVAAGPLFGQAWDVSLRSGATVGSPLTYANAGAVLRFGRNLPQDLPVTHISLGPPRDGFRGASSFGWYVWTGLDAHAVAYNTFIEGTSYRIGQGLQRVPFGHDIQAGAALAWPNLRLGFTWVQRSREFEGQVGPDRFGQLAVSFAY